MWTRPQRSPASATSSPEAHKLNPDDDPNVLADTLGDLATAIDDLDRWMSTGGFPPLPWAPDHTEAVAR